MAEVLDTFPKDVRGDGPFRAFISYASADNIPQKSLSQLKTTVETAINATHVRLGISGNYRCFRDAQSILTGPYDDQINRALNSADIFILLVSNNFLTSEYVKTVEWKHIKPCAASEKYLTILIKFDHCDQLAVLTGVADLQFLKGTDGSALEPLEGHPEGWGAVRNAVVGKIKEFLTQRHLGNEPSPEGASSSKAKKPINSEAKSMHTYVIGWGGVEPACLYKDSRFEDSPLAFVTTQLTLDTLPKLHYSSYPNDPLPAGFDVAYMDYEFSDRYYSAGRIHPASRFDSLKQLFGEGGHDDIQIEHAIMNYFYVNGRFLKNQPISVPIQFGFGEILVNTAGKLAHSLKAKALVHPNDFSYADFDLNKLLDDGETKIAIWHWYLPSLTHIRLSLSEGESVGMCLGEWKAPPVKFDDSGTRPDVVKYMKLICDRLEQEPGLAARIKICRNMHEVRATIGGSFKAGVIIGVGSSALVDEPNVLNESKADSVLAIIPKEGVTLWLNCAAAIKKDDSTPAVNLVTYWLRQSTQDRMFRFNIGDPSIEAAGGPNASRGRYVGLPVNKYSLDEVRSCFPGYRAVQTFEKLYDKETECFQDGRVFLRVLPLPIWGSLVNVWERFVAAADPDNEG